MKENKMLVADFTKLNDAKNALTKMRRGEAVNANDLLNVIEDTLNSFDLSQLKSNIPLILLIKSLEHFISVKFFR